MKNGIIVSKLNNINIFPYQLSQNIKFEAVDKS